MYCRSESFQTLLVVALVGAIFLPSRVFALTVPQDGSVQVGGGLLSLSCCDLFVEGNLTVTTGRIVARNIYIAQDAQLIVDGGSIAVYGEVVNDGTFDIGNGTFDHLGDAIKSIPLLSRWALAALAAVLSLIAAGFIYRVERGKE